MVEGKTVVKAAEAEVNKLSESERRIAYDAMTTNGVYEQKLIMVLNRTLAAYTKRLTDVEACIKYFEDNKAKFEEAVKPLKEMKKKSPKKCYKKIFPPLQYSRN